MDEEKFNWNPGAAGVPNYPMEYSMLSFVNADSTSVSSPTASVGYKGSQWGDNVASVQVGDDLKAVPVRLNVSWLSYTEDQFYTGSFVLPHDKILALFKKGWPDFDYGINKPMTSTFNEIVVGMAPGGMVVVWLSGAGHQVDVASFKAHKTDVDMKEFMDRSDYKFTRTEYTKYKLEDTAVANNLAKNGIPYGLWDKYREHFSMRPKIVFDQHEPVKIGTIVMDFLNGEQEEIDSAGVTKIEYTDRARIRSLNFNWSLQLGGKKQGFQLGITFEPAEIVKAYEEIYGKDNKGQGELLVQINRGNDHYQVFLQGDNKKVELVKARGEIYSQNN
jgi:hypothetical protein